MFLQPFDPNEAFQFSELKKLGYEDLIDKLNKREGAYLILQELPKRLPCSQDDLQPAGSRRYTVGDYFRPCELCGMVYHQVLNRQHEALALFRGLYEHMLRRQVALDVGMHKAMPLVWMAECHALLGHPVLAKRYMMLTAWPQGSHAAQASFCAPAHTDAPSTRRSGRPTALCQAAPRCDAPYAAACAARADRLPESRR